MTPPDRATLRSVEDPRGGCEGFVPLRDLRAALVRVPAGPGRFIVLRDAELVHQQNVSDLNRFLTQLCRQLRGVPTSHWGAQLLWDLEMRERALVIAWAAA